ncbi:hypothetical protein NA56DRAFT_702771 [Hyaloscypha hepaticicola]|uniref:Uncharacterized protein n=1 Tax=Hyaloscypha hepaticicola TaxID=2082293 RepID=A0A2J6Q847_9HELO|nr:hypothetical protein NA56DRAFT_702771 [Hyaloscypha hepaticicola]
MAAQEAICSIRIQRPAQLEQHVQGTSQNEAVPNHSPYNHNSVLAPENKPLLPLNERSEVLLDTRVKWLKLISEQVFDRKNLDGNSAIRDWGFILSLDGSGANHADNTLSSTQSNRVYPAQYRIPDEILERITSNQLKVQRAELFALGGLLYEVLSGKELLNELGGKESSIESRFRKGEFPDNVWELPYSNKILACWCPQFAKNLLAENQAKKSVLSKFITYIKNHPILFSIQITGCILSLASLVALPVLGAVGFGVAGPVAGSAAAGWQASMGLVEAGSIFSWCQSAAMGGAAVGGILATGLAGVGVAVGAVVAGALDDVITPAPDLKEKFLVAWRWDISKAEWQRGPKL